MNHDRIWSNSIKAFRLSIGINNIPPKICSYSCIYCQIGRTNQMQITRSEFYKPEEIYHEAKNKLKQLEAEHKKADYFSFVPDGEPTLDINLGKTIKLLKPLNGRIAVITNASLFWMDEVNENLMNADWVSVSLDGADELTWRKVDRPHRHLNHQRILDGMVEFSKKFQETPVTEIMFVDGVNDDEENMEKIAEQIAAIQPSKAYLLVPTRPPSETKVNRSSVETLRKAVAIIRGISGLNVECITEEEEEKGFFFTENIADDILGIASVHPIRENIIDKLNMGKYRCRNWALE